MKTRDLGYFYSIFNNINNIIYSYNTIIDPRFNVTLLPRNRAYDYIQVILFLKKEEVKTWPVKQEI